MCHDCELREGIPEELLVERGFELDGPLLQHVADGAQVGYFGVSEKKGQIVKVGTVTISDVSFNTFGGGHIGR